MYFFFKCIFFNFSLNAWPQVGVSHSGRNTVLVPEGRGPWNGITALGKPPSPPVPLFPLICHYYLKRWPNMQIPATALSLPKARLAYQLQRSHSISVCIFSSLRGLVFHQSDKQIKSHTQIKQFPVLQSHLVALHSGKHIVFDGCLGPLPRIFWCFCLWGTTTTCKECKEAASLHPALLMCAF